MEPKRNVYISWSLLLCAWYLLGNVEELDRGQSCDAVKENPFVVTNVQNNNDDLVCYMYMDSHLSWVFETQSAKDSQAFA